ncbi:MAG TPA: SurA N-terminal domain-containing protein [Mycobacteriales bacterium]|nr:SurA N-terminal domain-containing protein [Mycobacteriales bacterium]
MSRSTAHHPLRRRVAVTTALVAVAAVSLGCQSKLGAAAYVGAHRISDHDLSQAVNQGLADSQIKKAVDGSLGGDLATYRRVVLDTQVQHLLIGQAADRLHVAIRTVDVDEQLALLIAQAGGKDQARALFARNGLTERAGEQVIRDEVLLAEIGYANGAHRASDSELRAAYQTNLPQYTTMTLGVIQTTDQATAESLRGQLEDDPTSFADLARSHPGSGTTPSPQQISAVNTPPELLVKLNAVRPGHSVVFDQAGAAGQPDQFAVVQLVRRDVLSFEQVRAQLQSASLSAAENAAAPYLAKVAKQVRVRINPRYGAWDYTKNQVADLPHPQVKLPAPAAPQPQAAPGAGGQGDAGTPPSN